MKNSFIYKSFRLKKTGHGFFKKSLLFLCLIASSSYAAGPYSDLESSPQDDSSQKKVQIKSFSDLQKITPYTSISVIQKRYLPKTFRGELNLSISADINHTFFYLGGISGRAGFFITEDHGLGLEGFAILPPIFKLTTKDMIGAPNNILPLSVIFSQFYGGIYYKWSPIFGKFALLDRKIIYFDTYATLGAGINKVLNGIETIQGKIKTECFRNGKQQQGKCLKNTDERDYSKLASQIFPALTLGLGQLFSVNQRLAFNWELKWLYTFVKYEGGTLYTPTNINFSLGVNYYFPEANYR